MKTSIVFGLLIALSILSFVASAAAQEFTLTTTKANLVASKATIEVRELSDNPDAVIIATPLGETAARNPHPIGAWYYNGKWNIFNTDHATMPEGLSYKVEYFLRPDANHFVHVLTRTNIIDGGSVIDHPALNRNPNAQFTIFQNHAPDNRAAFLNKYPATAEYDAASGKWIIKNVGGERLFPDIAYNIVVTSTGAVAGNPPLPTTPVVPVVGTTLAPAPVAPLTVVVRDVWIAPNQGTFLPSGQCMIFQANYYNPAILHTDHVIATARSIASGNYLKWTATVGPGSITFNVCNGKKTSQSDQGAMLIDGRELNILVLR